jgi:hypothetical protein
MTVNEMPQPPGPPPEHPRESWPTRHKARTALLALAAISALAVAACGTAVTKANVPAAPAAQSTRPSQAPSPTPSPTNSLSGPVGTTYQVTDGSGNEITVTLTQIVDPAQGGDQYTTPDNGNRFAGAVFTLKGLSGTFSDDANNDAALIGSNGQTYTADFDSIAGYTNFNHGEYNLSPGQTSIGAVTFQVPDGVKVASVQWSGSGGFGGAPAIWAVTNADSSAPTGAVTEPWAVVSAYYGDITMRRYSAAWTLLGFSPQGGDYASFVAGYADTGRQIVTEISESGDQVTFTLTSDNPDGTVQTYQGTDTVTAGRITAAHVVQTG